MGRPLYTNNAATYLAFGITNTATTMQVSANAGGLFPNPVGGDYFYVSLISLSGPIIEIVKCTARNGDIFTIERGQEGTSPLYWNMGDNVQLRITAAGMNFISGASATTTEEETQTATQGQTLFTLNTIDYTPNTNNLAVFVNGSKQVSGVNFTETSLNTVTFTSGLNAGDVVEFIYGLTIASGTLYATDIKYNEGGTGAVTRTLESKLQESVSVLDFGADSTGTNDSTTAIQSAASSLTNGGSLYFPKGTYKVSSVVNFTDKTTVYGDGIGATIIQGTAGNTGGIFNCSDSSGTAIDRTSFHLYGMSIDGANTLDTTSTTLISGSFAQWVNAGGKFCISVGNTDEVLIENVRLTNSGYGIITSDCNNVILQNFEVSGMQWDGVSTYRIQQNLTVQNFNVQNTGRNGLGLFLGQGNVTAQNFYIYNCWCEGIEVEQYDAATTLKQVSILNGHIINVGTFAQIESYGTNSFGVIENCTFNGAMAHSGYSNLTTGEADQQYNLSSGAHWTGVPTFPVPNTPGTWVNIRYSGIDFEGLHGVAKSNSFINISLTTGAFAYGNANAVPNMRFEGNLFVSSNVRVNGGESWTLTGNTFNGSTLLFQQASGSFNNEPTAIISGNTFTGASNVTLQNNCLFTGNTLYGVVGTAIDVPVPSDGRTIISNNSIMDTTSAGTTIGINCEYQNPANCLIENNYINGMSTTGIALYDGGTSKGFVVTGNRIENSVIGVSINGGVSDVIQNNVMRNNTYDIQLSGIGGSAPAGVGIRIVGNLLQSTTSVYATNYYTLPNTTRFCNNEYTALSPSNIFSWGGSNTVQGNWS